MRSTNSLAYDLGEQTGCLLVQDPTIVASFRPAGFSEACHWLDGILDTLEASNVAPAGVHAALHSFGQFQLHYGTLPTYRGIPIAYNAELGPDEFIKLVMKTNP